MNKINQYNQWLLERYPNVWNSRIVWMLAINFIIHIVFFIIGYISHSNPKSLQDYNAINDYYTSGLIAVHLIISILLLVGWAITMFKNNAFKSFYPISRGSLFFQFLQYFVIILASTTFYFSYILGYKTYVNKAYDDATLTRIIDVSNTASAFLPYNIEDYKLGNRLTPKIFEELFIEKNLDRIDRSKPFVVDYDNAYQYFTKALVKVKKRDKKGNFVFPKKESEKYVGLAYNELRDNEMYYYFKDEVVDITPYITSTKPNFRNYSSILYFKSDYPYYYNRINYQDQEDIGFQDAYLKDRIKINRSVNAILDDKNPQTLSNLLKDFLTITKDHNINTNLNVEEWLKHIKKSDQHNVSFFVKSHRYGDDQIELTEDVYSIDMDASAADVKAGHSYIKELNPNINNELPPYKFVKKNMTKLFFDKKSLENILVNVDEIKNKEILDELIHVYIWIAFVLASVVFSFRVAGLRPLLFSIISFGVISLGITLISVLTTLSYHINAKYFVSYLCLFVGLGIILISIFGNKKSKNTPATIAMVIVINGISGFIFLIFGLIEMHQESMCENTTNCVTVMDALGANLSYVILLLAIIFIYFYTIVIQKWKSLPE